MRDSGSDRRMPAGFHLLIAAQFFSALADNALLIVTMALLQAQGLAAWWAPLLKFGFTLAYVLLAPAVGDLADAFPKARLMAWMNALKLLGAAALLLSVHPVLAFCVVGVGAAAYAPAKYGLVTERVPPARLVVANGWIEVSVVLAALLGTVLGGALVSGPWLALPAALAVQAQVAKAGLLDSPLALSLLAVLLLYLLAGVLNLGMADSGARYPRASIHPWKLLQAFRSANRTLWSDAEGGLSLAVTTVFWGVGAALQFMVLHWAGQALGLPLSQAAFLQAAVAVGVVLGAVLAGRWVPLARARQVLGAGVLLGLMLPVLSAVHSLPWAIALLVLAGALGGFMVVPLNALLQHRGCQLLSAGRSIAVQGFNENASVLAMLSLYAALLSAELPIARLMQGLGLGLAGFIAWLMWRFRPAAPPG